MSLVLYEPGQLLEESTMTAAIAILKYFREHKKALHEELAGDEFEALRTHLDIFATYWRGAQHLLRKAESELQPFELRNVRMAASEVLKEMAVRAELVHAEGALASLYRLEDGDTPATRRDFADWFIKEQLNRWYWGFRSTLKPGLSFGYEWLGVGEERMLSLKLMLGNAETLHTLYFTLPEETSTLGARLAALDGLVKEASQQMQTLILAPGNWPTEADVDDAATEAALRIADAMYRRLTPAQLSQLRNREDVILASFHAALKRY
jgi:hypothetical protein